MSEKLEFTTVDIADFFDEKSLDNISAKNDIVAFTEKQRALIGDVMKILSVLDISRCKVIQERINDLESLVASMMKFPSLLEGHELTADYRTPQSLIESLISNKNEGDAALQMPSKATLGRGFLVAKIHTFSSLTKLCRRISELKQLEGDFAVETISMMYLLMAEDVYLNLIRDTTIPTEFRRNFAMSLLLLWEHRSDHAISDIAPVLQSVWNARRALAPAFGTMVGTSELLLMSMQMDQQWIKFIKLKTGDTDVSEAMEEFLFGLSYEQINALRAVLKSRGISAIGRDEVSYFLGQHVKIDSGLDYRDFYSLYTVRRDNARARRRMNLIGPHKTLEDHFILFVTQMNKETQSKDSLAQQ